MKKIIVLAALVAFAAGIMFVCSDTAIAAAKDKPKAAVAAPITPVAPTPVAAAPEGKVVCKFKDKDQMAEFEQLYVAKQATFGRMSVLQAYFSLEQNNLQEIDRQMDKKFNFKMDSSKMYDLNRDGMEIREVGDVPQQPAPAENK
ncbi:MAG: hypothetical protein A2047_04195 [Omnitrophica bacterium GWA2_41_15]|nr:MAG: hypothetical protein A2047_04195 [Omnitrophica bacterium GWA2_41_15]HAZ10659.1 hypothetical protein [Candidatus Omnitrophota bacterium]